ncbi:MAG: hypothetical protein M1830_007335 [Pleopsidium flavum]|nr:MAG: hypothetical protein M1830_007335 [Pleopsidium flavum]
MSAQPIVAQPLLDSFVPGFSIISSLFSQYFHVDISFYISSLIVLTGIAAGLKYCGSILWGSVIENFISTAEIRLDDEMYNYVMAWVSSQSFSQKTCRFVAGTKTNSDLVLLDYDDDENQERDEEDSDITGGPQDYWLNITNREKIKTLQYTPSDGTHLFFYKGQYLAFTRRQEEQQSIFFASRSEQIHISCFGRNPKILKELLEEAQRAYLEKDGNKTVIYRGCKKSGDSDPQWVRCMSRPPRPLSTVVLDQTQKDDFIDDIKDYLHPSTRRWYSNRGIPYRRGYLFHGPPGTGKTSLCYSVAGLFGLKIFVVSLNSASLTEDGLAALFQDLPRRCILLLEDIDTAGMTAKRTETTEPTDDTAIKAKLTGTQDPTHTNTTPQKGISLSALLNIIDGVASAEGRLLVMTTNHIERLDKALRRPGRVDMTIGFGFADTPTIRGLYRAIYTRLEGDLPAGGPAPNGSAPTTTKANGHCVVPNGAAKTPSISHAQDPPTDVKTHIHNNHFTDSEIDALATSFAAAVPADEFTPAEIQGYLLKHKYAPAEAVSGAEAWVCGLRKEKSLGEVGDGGERDGEEI